MFALLIKRLEKQPIVRKDLKTIQQCMNKIESKLGNEVVQNFYVDRFITEKFYAQLLSI
jgi:hypothetical protein